MNATRRDFLKTLAMAPLGAAEPHLMVADAHAPWAATWSGRPFRTAIIGSGVHGLELLRGAASAGGCELVGVCDVDRDRLRPQPDLDFGAGLLHFASRFTCHRELLAATKPEIVLISSPDHWHMAQAQDALAQGAHVLLATPAALSIDGMRALGALAAKQDRVISLAASPQTFPAWNAAAKRLQKGEFGRPVSASVRLFYGRGQPDTTAPQRPPRALDWPRWCGPAGARPFHARWRAGAAGGGFLNQPAFSQGCLGRWGGALLQWVLDATGQCSPTSSWALGSMSQANVAFGFPESVGFKLSWQHQPAPASCIPDGEHDAAISIATDAGRLCLLSDGGWSFFPDQDHAQAAVGMVGETKPELSFARLWCSLCRSIDLKEPSPLNLHRMLAGSEVSAMAMLSLRLKRPVSLSSGALSYALDQELWVMGTPSSRRWGVLG